MEPIVTSTMTKFQDSEVGVGNSNEVLLSSVQCCLIRILTFLVLLRKCYLVCSGGKVPMYLLNLTELEISGLSYHLILNGQLGKLITLLKTRINSLQ